MREFIRHPTDIPIDVNISDGNDSASTINLSVGGICCRCAEYLAAGTLIDIRIPLVNPVYNGTGTVRWCKKCDDTGFEVGITFSDCQEAFRSRMVEQVCQIEHYKNTVLRNEGRKLSTEQAAQEWIQQYAADFAQNQ